MRISDWSSDVCPSDLAVARRHRGDLARGDFKDLLGDQRGGRALRRVLETRHRLGLLRFETFGRSHRGEGFAAAHAISQRLGLFLGKPRLLRSEEHTSELQSLMRISYAVFCLN